MDATDQQGRTDDPMNLHIGGDGPQPPDREDRTPETNGAGALPAEGGGSLLDALAQTRANIERETTTDMEVPNNGGLLWATYRLIDWRRVRQHGKVAQAENETAELNAAADMLADAVVGLWLRNPTTGERMAWAASVNAGDPRREFLATLDDVPPRYEPKLLQALGFDPPEGLRPREVVRIVMGGRDMAVIAHHASLIAWMEGSQEAVSATFAGE